MQEICSDELRVSGAGTTCTDVSAFGKGSGLLGNSSKPLSIFMSELKHSKPVSQIISIALHALCFLFSTDSQRIYII